MEYYGENGLNIYNDNGFVTEMDYCPCGCPPFEGRSIIYVDKHATGTGDGSSWENAYTDIQTAVNSHPKKEVQIKGYGENDYYYIVNLYLPDCAYLQGVGEGEERVFLQGNIQGSPTKVDMEGKSQKINNLVIKGRCRWVSGEISNCDITGLSNSTYQCFDQCAGIIKDCNVYDCYAKYEGYCFFWCNADIENCHVYNVTGGMVGFAAYKSVLNCTCDGGVRGFMDNNLQGFIYDVISITTNCCASNIKYIGFELLNDGHTLTSCFAENCRYGFSCNGDNTLLVECTAQNSQICGFRKGTERPTYTNCADINRCLTENEYLKTFCTPDDPNYDCEDI